MLKVVSKTATTGLVSQLVIQKASSYFFGG